jgi:hypothetical protein
MNETHEKKEELCICGFGTVVIVPEDNDHLCLNCRETRERHGWCMAEAVQRCQLYGENWTPAQVNALRERIEQPRRKHGPNRRRGW